MSLNALRCSGALLLSLGLCATGYAVKAQAGAKPYSRSISEAQDFAHQHQWVPAIDAARRAYGAADNDYGRIEAGYMIGRLQQQQGDIPGVLDTFRMLLPQVRCADGVREASRLLSLSAHFSFLDRNPEQGYQFITQAIKEVQRDTDPWGQVDPRDWLVQDGGHVLRYRLAGIALPTLADTRIVSLLDAGRRGSAAYLDYVDGLEQAPLRTLRVRIGLRGDAAKEATLNEALDASEQIRRLSGAGDQSGRQEEPGVPVVAQFAPVGSQHAARITGYTDKDQGPTRLGLWIARLGSWQVEIDATWTAGEDQRAQHAMAGFFAAITWRAEDALAPEDSARFEALQAQAVQAIDARDWTQAAQAAEAALPLAMFPDERARLYSAQGIAASERGKAAQALSLLQSALFDWRYSVMARNDEDLFDQTVLHAADAAFRQGETKRAIRWMNEIAGISIDGSWHLDRDTGVMQHRTTSISLPPRLGVFLRESFTDHTAYYVRTHPVQRLGVTILAPDPTAGLDDTIIRLRHWMQDRMGLEVSGVTHTVFAPASYGKAQGDFVLFHVMRPGSRPGVMNIGADAWPTGPRMMGFWISRIAGAQLVLRGEWAPGDTQARTAFNEAAEAFDWPASVEHMKTLPTYPAPASRSPCRADLSADTAQLPESGR